MEKLSVYRATCFEILEKDSVRLRIRNEDIVFIDSQALMAFAVLFGYQLDDHRPLKSKITTTPISFETYAAIGHDAYIYLIALSKVPSLDMLKGESLRDAICIFEGYCNGGLHHIDNWIMKKIGEPLITNILFNQTLEILIEND